MDDNMIRIVIEPYQAMIDQLKEENVYLKGLVETSDYRIQQLLNMLLPQTGSSTQIEDTVSEQTDTALSGGELDGDFPEPQ